MTQHNQHSSLFSQITLMHGNMNLIGRTILAAEEMCRAEGVALSFATPHEFLAANQDNRDTWLPVASIFNPQYSQVSSDNSFFILGRNNMNEIVACQACRFFDWRASNFKAECESLRLWYDDPAQKMKPDEVARVSSFAAGGTTGLVAYSGAAWYRPDFRGKGLIGYLPRLARAYASGLWNVGSVVTLMADNNIKRGVYARAGWKNIEWTVEVINNQSGNIKFAYLWAKAEELELDFNEFLDGLHVISGRRELRRAGGK
jgi:hypothetical protein